MPSPERRSCTSMFLRNPVGTRIRIFYAILVIRASCGLGTQGERNTSADIIGHFLGNHFRIDGTPVPLMFVGDIEPSDTVEDNGLDFDACGAVLVPYTLHPEIDIHILAIIVDEVAFGCGEREVEAISRCRFPVFR